MGKNVFLGLITLHIVLFFSSCSKLQTFILEDEARQALEETLVLCSDSAFSQSSQNAIMQLDNSTAISFPETHLISMDIVNSIPNGSESYDKIIGDICTESCVMSPEIAALFDEEIAKVSFENVYLLIESNNANATNYLKERNGAMLKSSLKSILKAKFNNTELKYYYQSFQGSYNMVVGEKVLTQELEDYLSDKLIERYFYLMALEEYNVRTLSSHQNSELLQKVFSNN